ncbi:hypothetical protein F4819DRAFT_225241 [Hypoxylon fuscum]|nr:hypothetical protein F4819DRAFT_225241 [Hypoxylon fuscum]
MFILSFFGLSGLFYLLGLFNVLGCLTLYQESRPHLSLAAKLPILPRIPEMAERFHLLPLHSTKPIHSPETEMNWLLAHISSTLPCDLNREK